MVSSIELKSVKKEFGKIKVLNGVSCELKEGEIVGLIGKSGCGKSTLLKILVGYHPVTSGSIIIDGQKMSQWKLKQLVGYTTQENSFYESLTIWENMIYYANVFSVPFSRRKERINMLLDQVGLFEHKNKRAEDISGGMKRRLDFAISLVHNPEILILDEPTTGLDPLSIKNFWDTVMKVTKEGHKIVFVASHILPEIEKYCDFAFVLEKGKIKEKKKKNLESVFKDETD